MKKINVIVMLLSVGVFVSCSGTEIEDEIGIDKDFDIETHSNCWSIQEINSSSGPIGPKPPLPPCF